MEKHHTRPHAGMTRAHVEELLDEALKATFPASDPVAITVDEPDVRRSMQASRAEKESPAAQSAKKSA